MRDSSETPSPEVARRATEYSISQSKRLKIGSTIPVADFQGATERTRPSPTGLKYVATASGTARDFAISSTNGKCTRALALSTCAGRRPR